jgi:hypothetical protein
VGKKKECYFCQNTGNTREHVPPICFFPDGYRKNLITVPSCEEHNSSKSMDDQYLLLVIGSNLEVNNLALNSIVPKITDSYLKKPALLKLILKNSFPGTINGTRTLADYEDI